MMSNVPWPKWKIYYEIFYNVYLNESKPKFREKLMSVKLLSFIVQIAYGDGMENRGLGF